jgi:amino acid transporter
VYALTVSPVRRGTRFLLTVEGLTVLLILVVSVIILAKLAAGSAPNGKEITFTPFAVQPGTETSALFLGVVFGFLSFAGFEAAATLGEEARQPRRDIPRAILGTAIFGGVYFTVVTAIEMMGFGVDDKGVAAFVASGNGKGTLGELGSSYVGNWVGDLITLGACVSAFACCLACIVGGSRLLFAITRDLAPGHPLGRTGTNDTPAAAAATLAVVVFLIGLVCAVFFDAIPFDTFFWSGAIGTLILLVAYVLATIGCIKLIWIDNKMPQVRPWEIVIPLAALVMIVYTLYRNVLPYPDSNPARWFPIVAGGWLLVVVLVTFLVPGFARRLSRALSELDQSEPEVLGG